MRRFLIPLMLFLSTCAHPPQWPNYPQRVRPESTQVFAVIGDFGRAGPYEAQVAKLVRSWSPDFVLTVGDNNYDKGEAETLDNNIGAYYREFIAFDKAYKGRYAEQGSPVQRFFPALGNHDWKTGTAQPFVDYFDLPGNERYYDVRRGDVHVFAIDSDRHEPDGIDADSKQAHWLKTALAASTAAWKIVYMHHPPYSTGKHGSSEVMRWPYAEWGASVVLAGHDHHYERTIINGFPYFIEGTGGAALRKADKPLFAFATASVRYAEQHGAMLIQATPQRLHLAHYNLDNALVDEYQLERPQNNATSSVYGHLSPQ